MSKKTVAAFFVLAAGGLMLLYYYSIERSPHQPEVHKKSSKNIHWFLLDREKNRESLYFGIPLQAAKSKLLRVFNVKSGVPGKKPTPKPQLAGREYWLIIAKSESRENPETAPYFLRLDVPGVGQEPYGPVPYMECDGQCNWERAGYFGLHGVAGLPDRLSQSDPGSSGCVRHADKDIEYLYNLLDPQKEEIRYYVI